MLGHRRLSIIDLKTGQQPLVDPRTNTALVYNGEIYNYRSLREKARRKHKYSFRTKTDSEVILPLYRHHGPGFVTMLRGMFAFALWDPARERLLLTRDRMGQKPLFYHRSNGKIVFSSELGALAHCDSIPTSVSDEALYLYTVLGYIPAPFTIYEELFQLPPACTFIWEDGRVSITSYWSLPPPGETNPIKNTEETRERFRALFRDAVETRMQADVPVGAFLSGGLDGRTRSNIFDWIFGSRF